MCIDDWKLYWWYLRKIDNREDEETIPYPPEEEQDDLWR